VRQAGKQHTIIDKTNVTRVIRIRYGVRMLGVITSVMLRVVGGVGLVPSDVVIVATDVRSGTSVRLVEWHVDVIQMVVCQEVKLTT
jgi:hypothetical protein